MHLDVLNRNSKIQNSCNFLIYRETFFKGTKGEISKLRKHNVDCHDEGLDQSVMKAFDDVKKAHPEAMMMGKKYISRAMHVESGSQ